MSKVKPFRPGVLKSLFLPLSCLLWLSACTLPQSVAAGAAPRPDDASVAGGSFAKNTPSAEDSYLAEGRKQTEALSSGQGLWRGVFISGAEVSEFTPCGSPGSYYWLRVMHASEAVDQLQELVHEIRLARAEPYPAVYIEFEGMETGKASDGFAADYDAVISLQRLLSFDKRIPTECQPRSN